MLGVFRPDPANVLNDAQNGKGATSALVEIKMPRPSVVLVTLALLGGAAGLGYSYATRTQPVQADERVPTSTEQPQALSNEPDAPEPPALTTANSSQPAAPATVAQWIADTQSFDAKMRAAAIAALADAPKEQAVPALERVLEVGEPQVDRQIALRSLHVLALQDGDADGAIRDVVRQAMYHSDDEGVTQSAQAILEDIEEELAVMPR